MRIGRRHAGDGQPLYVVAEIGLNHGGSLDRALALVDAAARAGASAVKVQTLFAAELVAPSCPAPAHVTAASLQDFFAAFELDEHAHRTIAERARAHDLAFIATPLFERAVDLLERVGVDAYKIASGDLTWTTLIERCARTGKPLIISTGMATLAEARDAVDRARSAGAREIALLHCVSAYPVPDGSENLRAIATLAQACGVPVGLSDHAADTFSVPIAIALGAALYERHLVFSSTDDAVDAAVSSTPEELASVVRTAARAGSALGSGAKMCATAEAVNVVASRRGLYATRLLRPGHIVADGDVIALRPASDLSPDDCSQLIGVVLTRTVSAGAAFTRADLRADASQGASAKDYRGVA